MKPKLQVSFSREGNLKKSRFRITLTTHCFKAAVPIKKLIH